MARKLLVALNIALFAGSMVFCTYENEASASTSMGKDCRACHAEKYKDKTHVKKMKCTACHG
jgi:hypothetical protein